MYVVITTSVFTGLAVSVVALRLYTRIYMVKAPGIDDLLISCALVCDLALFAFILLERKYGIGIHSSKLSEHDLQSQLFWLWLSVPFYNMTMIFAKISALTLFARLFRPRPFLLATYIVMGFLVIVGLWTTLSGFFFCVPVHSFWSPYEEVRLAKCLPAAPVWFTNAALQTATDLVILIMPLPLLWKLQLPKRQRWGILVVFSLGIFTIGTSCARLYPLSVMVGGGDMTKANAQAALWSSLEGNVSIICICLPPLHPLLSRVFSFFFLPRPIQSRASKAHSSRTQMTEPLNRDGEIWCNELFTPGPASYCTSISKVNTNEEDHENEEGIRVKRELRMQSDTLPSPPIRPHSANGAHLDMGEGALAARSHTAPENPRSNPSVERDFGDFEFPDYKDKMNAPI
ncbi:unnamed protein product [Penicillium nalgiovense]|uniref:Rhodopsin domain-containing protein n=1 Tax=Penicillium nalgiovense TaxID=60175 RepID=A0A1V6YTX9_PENNA|nr:hypothetical protein PENNAL_c0011G00331 [Penicillium nalgiovense]CAG7962272.1 unnamed protein product [Penicillium nalgiovense]CAG7988866.1 unnamed protein product [Penicillium nalgiovense]CAG7990038.1 unnamed protein product [Penicillium nalgiovense]CAG8013216.1 unnamed protein product [Penicillium nalgiovense]